MTPSNSNTTMRFLSFLAVTAAYQSSAFVTSPPAVSLTQAVATGSSSRLSPLFVVADPPNREDEKTRRGGKGNSDDDEEEDSWVATGNGGFLPKIPSFIREKLGNKKQTSASTVAPSKPATTRRTSGKPEEVLTIQEYKAIVADEKDCIVCVRFYAPWCKACKAVQQPFRKLCRTTPQVKFVEVPLTKENAFLHEGLGIPSLPYGHIYHPTAGLVEERKINLKKKEFATFEQVLQTYVQGECPVDYELDEQGRLVCTSANDLVAP